MNKRGRYFKSSRLLVISLAIISIVILLISYWYYEVEKGQFISQYNSQLNSIAEAKVNQVVDWRSERYGDARYLSVSSLINESFIGLLRDPDNSIYRKMLEENLIGMFLNGKYENMAAIDRTGRVFFSINNSDTTLIEYLSLQKPDSGSTDVQISDFLMSTNGIAMMNIMIPQVEVLEEDSIVAGWLALSINLSKTFFPFLESIPVPSESMEVILSFPENINKMELNLKGSATMKRLPFNPEKFRKPGSQLSKQSQSGFDDVVKDILEVHHEIPGSGVLLKVKINKSEAYAPLRKLRFGIMAFSGLIILTFTSTVSYFWSRQKNEILAYETEKRMLLERFDMLSKFANDAIIVYTRDLTILQVNDKALDLYGYSRDEILGMGAEQLSSPELRSELNSILELTIREEGYRFDTIHVRKDGTTFPVEESLRYMELMGSPCFQSVVRDITQRKQFEKALLAGEERLRLMTNTMPQIVWTARPDGRIDFVNSRFELLTGFYPLKESATLDFIHPDDRDRVINYWKEAIDIIDEHQIRFRVLMKDGKFRWFLCIAIPMCDEEGKVIRWYGSGTDIDELENRVAARTAELSDLYNNAPCGYHSLDINGIFVNINDTALQWLGYKREELVGRLSFVDLTTEESRKNFAGNFQHVKTTGFVDNLEYTMVRKDGTHLPVLLSATSVKDARGHVVMTRSTMIDHTVRKQHESEIMKLNTILQEHSYNLEYANKELEAFIFSVSHDLRAPLRAINGFSHILLDDYSDKLDAEGQKLIEKVWSNADRMRQLIEDLLRLSRTGRNELTYSNIDMQALFTSLLEETRQQFTDKEVQAVIHPMPMATGDIALLKQVISNLLSNAVKFSGKNKASELEIGSVTGDDEVTFYIKDNGIGFDMKFSGELFGVFKRLNNAEDYEGTGVGLALVKRIIDKHGGRVWAFSEKGKGATFYFSIPVNKIA